ncbi:hypothetical protein J6590_048233 [Homalodisca vitripennis]|nr:hypothetical protein J6590_048233 [Homalodisca vitripennis]
MTVEPKWTEIEEGKTDVHVNQDALDQEGLFNKTEITPSTKTLIVENTTPSVTATKSIVSERVFSTIVSSVYISKIPPELKVTKSLNDYITLDNTVKTTERSNYDTSDELREDSIPIETKRSSARKYHNKNVSHGSQTGSTPTDTISSTEGTQDTTPGLITVVESLEDHNSETTADKQTTVSTTKLMWFDEDYLY